MTENVSQESGRRCRILSKRNRKYMAWEGAAKMQALVGPAKVEWKEGLRRMVEDRHPDWLV